MTALPNPWQFSSAASVAEIPESVEPDRLAVNSAGAACENPVPAAFSSNLLTPNLDASPKPDCVVSGARQDRAQINDTQYDTSDIPELLRALNNMTKHPHPIDLDALAANLEKIDQRSYPEDREELRFLRGIDPIYYDVQKARTPFLKKLFGSAGARA